MRERGEIMRGGGRGRQGREGGMGGRCKDSEGGKNVGRRDI